MGSTLRRIRCWWTRIGTNTRSSGSWTSICASRLITRITSRLRGATRHRAALGKPKATLAALAAEAKVSAKYLPMIWDLSGSCAKAKEEVGPIAKLQEMWKALPGPMGRSRGSLRAKCVEMRDFVVQTPEAHIDAVRCAEGPRAAAGRSRS